jgi:hypothetical protein
MENKLTKDDIKMYVIWLSTCNSDVWTIIKSEIKYFLIILAELKGTAC